MIPIEKDGGFITDGTGGGTEKRIIQHGHWSAVYASCQCPGSGQWVVGKPGRALYFQQGANVILGPVILRPGEQMQVTVAGATAAQQASIVYSGWQGDAQDGSDLAQAVPSIESAGSLAGGVPVNISGGTVGITGNVPVLNATGTSLSTVQPMRLMGSVTAAGSGGSNSGSFTLQTGEIGIAYLVDQSGAFHIPAQVEINGNQSSNTYLNETAVNASGAPLGLHGVLIGEGLDTSLNVLVVSDAADANQVRIQVFALTAPLADLVSIPVPAPWQAPQSFKNFRFTNPATNSSVVVLGGASGQTIYLHGMIRTWEGTSSQLEGDWQTTLLQKLFSDSNPTSDTTDWFDFKGVALPSGAGFEFTQTFGPAAGTITCSGGLTYTIV